VKSGSFPPSSTSASVSILPHAALRLVCINWDDQIMLISDLFKARRPLLAPGPVTFCRENSVNPVRGPPRSFAFKSYFPFYALLGFVFRNPFLAVRSAREMFSSFCNNIFISSVFISIAVIALLNSVTSKRLRSLPSVCVVCVLCVLCVVD
jgi:hypothetical protein